MLVWSVVIIWKAGLVFNNNTTLARGGTAEYCTSNSYPFPLPTQTNLIAMSDDAEDIYMPTHCFLVGCLVL
jgi:hypothetical protein